MGLRPVWPLTWTSHSPTHSCCSQEGNSFFVPFSERWLWSADASHRLVDAVTSALQHPVFSTLSASVQLLLQYLFTCHWAVVITPRQPNQDDVPRVADLQHRQICWSVRNICRSQRQHNSRTTVRTQLWFEWQELLQGGSSDEQQPASYCFVF